MILKLKHVLYFIYTCILFCSCNNVKEDMVDVKVSSTYGTIHPKITSFKNEKNEKCIGISLTNNGNKEDSIISIKINISPDILINEKTKVLFGGTCMGRTPLQISNVNDTINNSGTFLMLNNNDNEYWLIGATTWNMFLPNIRMNGKNHITIEANGENKAVGSGETIQFEKFVTTKGNNWQDLMFGYGKSIASEQKIEPIKQYNWKGWATWDYYGRVYDNNDIIKNVEELTRNNIDANLIQIDGGWWISRGDYLSVRNNLIGGMKGIADYIKSKGLTPGIHLDGFRADLSSEIYKKHPDWFLKDQDGETIFQPIDKGDTFMRYIYFDYSNPEVCQYIKDILTTIRTDWGFEYFKIDFMRYGLYETIMDLHGPKRIPYEDVAEGVSKSIIKNNSNDDMKTITKIVSYGNMTSVERTRAGLKAMREGIGDKFFLGCSSIFGPTFGIVDGLRTGGDISPRYDFYMTRVLQNAGNFYLNGTVAQTDADYLVVRNKYDEEGKRAWGKYKFGGETSLNEVKMWSDYIALNGGIQLSSDNLVTLRSERKKLVKDAFSHKTAIRFIPLDLWEHAQNKQDAFNIILTENINGVYITLFNWSSDSKEYTISGLNDANITIDGNKNKEYVKKDNAKYTLKAHSSIILKVSNASFDVLRKLLYLQPIITQYFIDNKSEIWLLFLIAHSKR